MNVRRSVWVAVEQFQKRAGRPIKWNGVRCWSDAVEGVFAILVCHKLASQVEVLLVGVLLLIVAVGGGHPDIDCGAHERLLGLRARDLAVHVHWLSVGWGIVRDVGALGQGGMIVSEEGTEDGALSGYIGSLSRLLVGDLVYQTVPVSYCAGNLCVALLTTRCREHRT